MRIVIFDVSHGFCTYVVSENGNVILIDCGHNNQTGFRPSEYLRKEGCNRIEGFIVSNYDEDHLSDLPNLRQIFDIRALGRNLSINEDELYRLKLEAGQILPGMGALLNMIPIYTGNIPFPADFSGIRVSFFYNRYPYFKDTNNLSLVTFLDYLDIHFIFPGDLEKPGWLSLLELQSFRERLSRVSLFVASHHGRENGYCPEVFKYCHPELIIVSDESIQYDSQQTDYKKHARGVKWEDGKDRYVLTTRNDGMITVTQRQGDFPRIWKAR